MPQTQAMRTRGHALAVMARSVAVAVAVEAAEVAAAEIAAKAASVAEVAARPLQVAEPHPARDSEEGSKTEAQEEVEVQAI